MEQERTITTREFLRNFKTFKNGLISGQWHIVRVRVDNDRELEITSKRTKTAADFVRAARALGRPIRIRRAHIFDQLLRPHRHR